MTQSVYLIIAHECDIDRDDEEKNETLFCVKTEEKAIEICDGLNKTARRQKTMNDMLDLFVYEYHQENPMQKRPTKDQSKTLQQWENETDRHHKEIYNPWINRFNASLESYKQTIDVDSLLEDENPLVTHSYRKIDLLD